MSEQGAGQGHLFKESGIHPSSSACLRLASKTWHFHFSKATALACSYHRLENAPSENPSHSLPQLPILGEVTTYRPRKSCGPHRPDSSVSSTPLPCATGCGLQGATLCSRLLTSSEISRWKCNRGRTLEHHWALMGCTSPPRLELEESGLQTKRGHRLINS